MISPYSKFYIEISTQYTGFVEASNFLKASENLLKIAENSSIMVYVRLDYVGTQSTERDVLWQNVHQNRQKRN